MLCIILCFALGIANIFHFHLIIIWSIICLYAPLLSLHLPPSITFSHVSSDGSCQSLLLRPHLH